MKAFVSYIDDDEKKVNTSPVSSVYVNATDSIGQMVGGLGSFMPIFAVMVVIIIIGIVVKTVGGFGGDVCM